MSEYEMEQMEQYEGYNEMEEYEPNPSGASLLAMLLAAAAGGVATYFGYRWWAAHKMAVSDPVLVMQAQMNLEAITKNPLQPSAPTVTPFVHNIATVGSVTADFTASLASIQAWINANGQSILNSIKGPAAGPQIASELALPLRVDGVLDQKTFNWLTFGANA